MAPIKFGVGQSVLRKEDDALIRGKGRYTDDHAPQPALHALVLRSPHAHATFTIDATRARGLPGVGLILTGEDVADLGSLPCLFNLETHPFKGPPYPILAQGEVRHVGDAVAFVVADTIDQARDAIEAIAVEWTPLPAVVGVAHAVKPGAPQVWPDHPGNVLFDEPIGDKQATDAAFAKAHAVAEIAIVNPRIVTNFMETRAAVCEYDAKRDHLTLTVGSQGSHRLREIIAGMVLKMPLEKMRVICPDVGGGFGTKLFPYREYALIAVAARKLRQTIKWTADRSDHFMGDSQGRDKRHHRADGAGRGRQVPRHGRRPDGRHGRVSVDLRALYSLWRAGMLPGLYDIQTFHCRVRTVFTNTVPVDAYRGAGRPEAAYVVERLVDAAARKLGMTPDAIRRKNFIPPRAMPYKTATGKVYDSGDFTAHMKRAMEVGNWKEFPKRAKAAKKQGLVRGIGLATYVEVCGTMGEETAKVQLDPNGDVTILIAPSRAGRAIRPPTRNWSPSSSGCRPSASMSCRATPTGSRPGSAPAARPRFRPAASASSAPQANSAGSCARSPPRRWRPAPAISRSATAPFASPAPIAPSALPIWRSGRASIPSKLDASATFAAADGTFPNGTHLAEVEIDPATGIIRIVNYVIVDDFGVTLNPLLLEGQVHGGAMQGIGQALMEQAVYSATDGQLVTGTFMDYAMPRAADGPSFVFETHNVPCKTNPLGVKGAGEAGAIGSCPAIVNAIVEGLWREYRIDHIDMPATPERVWVAIREHQRRHSL